MAILQDPIKNYRFLFEIDDKPVFGINSFIIPEIYYERNFWGFGKLNFTDLIIKSCIIFKNEDKNFFIEWFNNFSVKKCNVKLLAVDGVTIVHNYEMMIWPKQWKISEFNALGEGQNVIQSIIFNVDYLRNV